MSNSFNIEDEQPQLENNNGFQQSANISFKDQTDRDTAGQPITQPDHQYQYQYGPTLTTHHGFHYLNTPHATTPCYTHQFSQSPNPQWVPYHMPRPTGQPYNHYSGLPGSIEGGRPHLGGMLPLDVYGSVSTLVPSQSAFTPHNSQIQPPHSISHSRHAYPEIQQGLYHQNPSLLPQQPRQSTGPPPVPPYTCATQTTIFNDSMSVYQHFQNPVIPYEYNIIYPDIDFVSRKPHGSTHAVINTSLNNDHCLPQSTQIQSYPTPIFIPNPPSQPSLSLQTARQLATPSPKRMCLHNQSDLPKSIYVSTQMVQHARAHCLDTNTSMFFRPWSDSHQGTDFLASRGATNLTSVYSSSRTPQHLSPAIVSHEPSETIHQHSVVSTTSSWSDNHQITTNQVIRAPVNTLISEHIPQASLIPDTASDISVLRLDPKECLGGSPNSGMSSLPAISTQTFNQVYTILQSNGVQTKWYELGLTLGFSAASLNGIRIDEFYQTEGCLRKMLHKRMEIKPLTWEEIVVALRSPTVKRNDLAEKIEKGDLKCSSSKARVDTLSGEPTLEELCALPVEKVWYQLGVWLGVEDIILRVEKGSRPSDKLKWIFTAFLNLPIGTRQYQMFIKDSSYELSQQAEVLLKQFQITHFIKLFPSSKQTAAEELAKKRRDPKYPTLITALVKVGQRKVAEEVCSKKGTCMGSICV